MIQAAWGLEPGHIWAAILVGHATRCVLSVGWLRKEKWRGIQVRVDPAGPTS